ncbi:MAG: UDP-3-O-(3-hydroxymyristoyl)glucosamine N-acyltransferase [Terriglobia bacterium]
MTVDDIARVLGGKVHGNGRAEIQTVAQLETASASELAYAEGNRALDCATLSHAGCILVIDSSSLPHRTTIEVSHPKLAFIQAAAALRPALPHPAGIHPSAVISPVARLGNGVYAGPNVVVEDEAQIGDGTILMAGACLGKGARVGAGCVLHPGVILYPGARVGDRVILHAGAVIGGDGFGYVRAESGYLKFPQMGGVLIEDDVEIGCNTTVDRGSLGTTVIGSGTKIDNLVQVAHNVRIGRHCVIAAQTGISGSVEIGDEVVIGGQVGIGDHARIERRATVGSGAGILTGKVIREGSVVWGTPARPLAEAKRLYASFARLPELARKVKEISRKKPEGRN